MNALLFIYALALFFVLTPNVLVKIPMKGSKYLVAAVHALIFAVVWIFTYRFLVPVTGNAPVHGRTMEGMTPATSSYDSEILTALLMGYQNKNPSAVASINAIMTDPEVIKQPIVKKEIDIYKKAHPIPGAASGSVASTVTATPPPAKATTAVAK